MFDTPQLAQFISRTPKFRAHDELRVDLSDWKVSVTLTQASDQRVHLQVICRPPHQLLSLARVCSSSFPRAFISAVKYLYIEGSYWRKSDIKRSRWLEFFQPLAFTAVKGLYLSQQLASSIVLALQKLTGESVTEVLPGLETLFLETFPSGPVEDAIVQFVAARQLAGYPIAISHWTPGKDVRDEFED